MLPYPGNFVDSSAGWESGRASWGTRDNCERVCWPFGGPYKGPGRAESRRKGLCGPPHPYNNTSPNFNISDTLPTHICRVRFSLVSRQMSRKWKEGDTIPRDRSETKTACPVELGWGVIAVVVRQYQDLGRTPAALRPDAGRTPAGLPTCSHCQFCLAIYDIQSDFAKDPREVGPGTRDQRRVPDTRFNPSLGEREGRTKGESSDAAVTADLAVLLRVCPPRWRWLPRLFHRRQSHAFHMHLVEFNGRSDSFHTLDWDYTNNDHCVHGWHWKGYYWSWAKSLCFLHFKVMNFYQYISVHLFV